MSELKNPMDVYKILEGSNCKECGLPTCLAFAASVIQSGKNLNDCTRLDSDIIKQFGKVEAKQSSIEQDLDKAVAQLKEQVRGLDLAALASQLGGEFARGKLKLKTMGKDFFIDQEGNLSSSIHLHPWVAITLLGYIVNCLGKPVATKWVPFRELSGGRERAGLFGQMCEKPLKTLADRHIDLFNDMIDIFNGKQEDSLFSSDISVILHPLPLIPVLICYWQPEDGMESSLNLFFDITATDNLGIDNVHSLGVGLTQMLQKITQTHGG